jgi:hypothetical protein
MLWSQFCVGMLSVLGAFFCSKLVRIQIRIIFGSWIRCKAGSRSPLNSTFRQFWVSKWRREGHGRSQGRRVWCSLAEDSHHYDDWWGAGFGSRLALKWKVGSGSASKLMLDQVLDPLLVTVPKFNCSNQCVNKLKMCLIMPKYEQ